MSISFYPYVRTATGWDFPPGVNEKLKSELVPTHGTPEYEAWYNDEIQCPNPDYDARLDVNLCARNARFVLNELGLITNGDLRDQEPMTLDAFEAGVQATISRNPEPIPGLSGHEDNTPGRVKMIEFDTEDGYANRQFQRLLVFVQAAREHGATHIGWD